MSGRVGKLPNRPGLRSSVHTLRAGLPHSRSFWSLVSNVNCSIRACASRIRSNGSEWSDGSAPTSRTCGARTGGSSNRACNARSRSRTGSTLKSLRPRPFLITTSQMAATLIRMSFAGFAMILRASTLIDGEFCAAQSRTWVSSK
jgi:hypothetical protein